ELQRTVLVHHRDVAGAKPTVVEPLGTGGVAVVLAGHPIPRHLELAHRLVVPGHLGPVFGHDSEADAGHDPSLASPCAEPFALRYCRSPVHTVGTPVATVTRSLSIRSASEAGSALNCPANTGLAPAIIAANGMPHAFAWNIGTTGSTAS